MNKLLPLIIIVGPTAVGKTRAGIRTAQRVGGEVISGDSMQVYKHMDIGTAKPSPEEMDGIPHHMIDLFEPSADFSVALFQKMVDGHIRDINARGKIPLLVGGTGLYINAVLDYYDFSPPGGDLQKRTELSALAAELGNGYLMSQLREVDPAAAARIHLNDTKRLIRALEVYHATGRPISAFQYKTEPRPPKYDLAYFGLTMDRDRLYRRIEARVDAMVSTGLIDEVRNLIQRGYGIRNSAMQALGYKEILEYLEGKCGLDEAVELIKRNTRRFAKRQLTWFRRDPRIKWKTVENGSSLEEIALEIAREAEGQFGRM